MIRDLFNMAAALFRGDYPDFVTRGPKDGALPVFTFHRVCPETFRHQLEYLKRNGYRTLTTEEIEAALNSEKNWPGNEIVLTFDDGLEDLYTEAYPMLKAYGFRAIAFVAPWWVGTAGVVTWEQTQEMHTSGIIDIQSHSYAHTLIPVSPRVIDFYHPGMAGVKKWDVAVFDGGHLLPPQNPEWGTPIHEFTSGLSDRLRCLGDPMLTEKCVRLVRDAGGSSFFEQKGWRSRLMRVVQETPTVRQFETLEEQRSRIRNELKRAKEVLEEHLPGKRVTAFAYPHHIQGRATALLLQSCGYRLVFGGVQSDAGFADPNPGYYYFKRVNEDFVERLPGAGQKSLMEIMADKTRRTLSFPNKEMS